MSIRFWCNLTLISYDTHRTNWAHVNAYGNTLLDNIRDSIHPRWYNFGTENECWWKSNTHAHTHNIAPRGTNKKSRWMLIFIHMQYGFYGAYVRACFCASLLALQFGSIHRAFFIFISIFDMNRLLYIAPYSIAPSSRKGTPGQEWKRDGFYMNSTSCFSYMV